MFTNPIVAYFDPGSASLVMQAVVGGSAGLFVFAKYLWKSAPTLFLGRKSSDAQVES
jgi:hypothetical protein